MSAYRLMITDRFGRQRLQLTPLCGRYSEVLLGAASAQFTFDVLTTGPLSATSTLHPFFTAGVQLWDRLTLHHVGPTGQLTHLWSGWLTHYDCTLTSLTLHGRGYRTYARRQLLHDPLTHIGPACTALTAGWAHVDARWAQGLTLSCTTTQTVAIDLPVGASLSDLLTEVTTAGAEWRYREGMLTVSDQVGQTIAQGLNFTAIDPDAATVCLPERLRTDGRDRVTSVVLTGAPYPLTGTTPTYAQTVTQPTDTVQLGEAYHHPHTDASDLPARADTWLTRGTLTDRTLQLALRPDRWAVGALGLGDNVTVLVRTGVPCFDYAGPRRVIEQQVEFGAAGHQQRVTLAGQPHRQVQLLTLAERVAQLEVNVI